MPSARGTATPPLLLNPEQRYDRYSSDAELRFVQLRTEFGFQSIAAFSFFLICVTLNREHSGSWRQDMSGRCGAEAEKSNTSTAKGKRCGSVAGTEAGLGFYCRVKVNWLGGSSANSHLLPAPCACTRDHAGPVGKSLGKWPQPDHHTENLPAVRLLHCPWNPTSVFQFSTKNVLSSLLMSTYGLYLYYSPPPASWNLLFHKNAEQLWEEI